MSLLKIEADSLGSETFRKDYNLKYSYVAGAMVRGISSKELVSKMGKAGMLGFFGSGGMLMTDIEDNIRHIKRTLQNAEPWGVNLLNNPLEGELVDVLLKYRVRNVEAAAYMAVTPEVVRYRLKGLSKNPDGTTRVSNKIMAKISRPEVARSFLSPPPDRILNQLLAEKKISEFEAGLSRSIPMADDITVEADSGGHTDRRTPYALMPSMITLRDRMMRKYQYKKKIRIGAAGGIGTPEAAAAAFILGADYIVTGSINQCTVEAGTSEAVKELLQDIDIQDTGYAPAGDMFELGAKIQVLKKGVFFPNRANKLYDLYKHHGSINEIDKKTRKELQERYFKKNFDDIYEKCKKFYPSSMIAKADKNPKVKMALIFKWYYGFSSRKALQGDKEHIVDFQINCGPALGAFNQWVKATPLEIWQNRNVDSIALELLDKTADLLNRRFKEMSQSSKKR